MLLNSYKYSKLDCCENKYGTHRSGVAVFIWPECFIYVNSGCLFQSVEFRMSKIFQPLNTFPAMQPQRRPFTWPFIAKRTLFMLPFLAIFFAKHMKHTILTEADTGGEGVLSCVCTRMTHAGFRAAFLLMVATGQWRCVFKKQLTGDLLDHELCLSNISARVPQPVFPIAVARCKRATCSPTTVINEDFFFFRVTQPKRGGIDIWGWGVNR